jgi:hypothetical protein
LHTIVIHRRSQDITKAKDKGRVSIVFEGTVNSFDVQTLFGQLSKVMTSADTSKEYVLPMGSAVVNFIAGLALGMERPEQVKFLIHEAKTGTYKEVVLEVKRNGR